MQSVYKPKILNKSDKIAQLSDALEDWLQPDNNKLKEAIDRTVSESLFSFEDVKHRVLSLKESLSNKNLENWAEKSGLIDESISGKAILCLHAGNLPMVGLQDLLAVMLTGGRYVGKLSKKDPYLLESLLAKLNDHGIGEGSVQNINLENLRGTDADAVLFSGSEKSVAAVKKKLHTLGMIHSNTPILMRTAHFSIAWIHDQHPETMRQLIKGALRYAGKGCRSIAIVVAPFKFTSNSCNFTDYVEEFWIKNPQKDKPSKSLYHRYALNKAVGTSQIWLDDFLIEEDLKEPDENFVLQWIEGGEDELLDIISMYKSGLQSIYSTGTYIGKEIGDREIEPLEEAQNPPIWWRPDGIDTIEWLQNHFIPLT